MWQQSGQAVFICVNSHFTFAFPIAFGIAFFSDSSKPIHFNAQMSNWPMVGVYCTRTIFIIIKFIVAFCYPSNFKRITGWTLDTRFSIALVIWCMLQFFMHAAMAAGLCSFFLLSPGLRVNTSNALHNIA